MFFTICTLGCRLNQAESDQITNDLISASFFYTQEMKKADICIINTCSVTHKADRTTRNLIRGIKRINQNIKIITCGCGKHKMPEIDLNVRDKNKIIEIIKNKFNPKQQKIIKDDGNNGYLKRVRSNIKIQTGCDNYCAYCIVPYLRGKPESVKIDKITHEVIMREQAGTKEIILTGVNIGKYSYKSLNLLDLINTLLIKTNIARIRLSSINPEDIDDHLIEAFKNDRICHHLHLSLQSGSDSVLQRMGRKYTAKDYLTIVKNLRNLDKNFGITTDVIVGFPGETEEEFLATCNFIKKIKFNRVHIFKYSSRKGTSAEKMNNQVSNEEKKKRYNILRKIAEDGEKKILMDNISKIYPVLFENINRDGSYSGYTPNYIRVKLSSDISLTNVIKKVKINKENILI